MSEEFMKVENLKTYSRRVNVKVKVLSKTESREVTSKRSGSTFNVAEALVGDETGCVLLDLWDDDIEKFDEGDVINIKVERDGRILEREIKFPVIPKAPVEEVQEEPSAIPKRPKSSI